MVVSVDRVSRTYYDVTAGIPIAVDIPVQLSSDIQVFMGDQTTPVVENVDYGITLAADFNTFVLMPYTSLITKINDGITNGTLDVNRITVKRELDLTTDATASAVRQTQFTADEFDRTAMRFQQLNERLGRALRVPPGVGGQPDMPVAPSSLLGFDALKRFATYPLAAGLENAVIVITKPQLIGDGTAGPYALDVDPVSASSVDLFVGGAPQQPGDDYALVDMAGAPSGKGLLILPNAPLGAKIKATVRRPSTTTSATDPDNIIMPDGLSVRAWNSYLSSGFVSRVELLDWWNNYGHLVPAGVRLYEPKAGYVVKTGATGIPDALGLEPYSSVSPWHFISNEYPTDVTAGLNAFLSYCHTTGTNPNWGVKSDGFAFSGNLANFHGKRHIGRARLVHTSGTFYVGDAWTADVANTFYVGVSGVSTNDGLTPSTPMDFVGGYNAFKELVAQNTNAVWTFRILSGTWGDVASRRLETFPTTKNVVVFEGEKDGTGEPTTVFNGMTQNLFRKLDGNSAINVRFKDIKFTNVVSVNGVMYLAYAGYVAYENIWAREVEAASILSIRYANGEVKDCDLWNTAAGGVECTSGIVVQDFYGDVNGNKVDGIVNTGQTGHAIQPSRGGISYVQNNELGLRDANDYHIDVSRIKRDRVRGNAFGPANVAAYRGQQITLWNDDNTDYDDISGMGLAVGDSFARLLPGAFYSRVHNGLSRVGHTFSNSVLSIPANNSRHFAKSLNGEWVPFKVPSWWLFSPNARGWFDFEVYFPETETVLFELNGNANGTGQRLAAANVSVTAGNRAIISMEFTGPIDAGGGVAGRYNSFIRLPSAATTQFGGTGGLSNPAMAAGNMNDLECRLYVTRSSGTTGTVDLLHFRSEINVG